MTSGAPGPMGHPGPEGPKGQKGSQGTASVSADTCQIMSESVNKMSAQVNMERRAHQVSGVVRVHLGPEVIRVLQVLD